MIVFVTGPRGAGKTTFCDVLFRFLTVEAPATGPLRKGLALLSRRLPDDTGYDLETLQPQLSANPSVGAPSENPDGSPVSGLDRTRLPLARRGNLAPDWKGDVLGPWVFSADAFRHAEKRFDEFFAGLAKGGPFVLDEIGPLELKLGRGYAKILPRLPELPRVVVVVRPGLLGALLGRMGSSAVIEVEPGIVDDGPGLKRLLRRAGEALG